MKKILTAIIIAEAAVIIAQGIALIKNKPEQTENNIATAKGHFHYELECINTETDKTEKTYQFKSNDNKTWWLLTESEIGRIPDFETEYTVTYWNNGTTAENKTCDCPPEWDCECEVYDDVFIKIEETKG